MTDPDWYIVLVAPQRELTTGWRFHREGLELHVPIIRRKVKAGGWRSKSAKVRTLAPRAMFPGYGFVRVDAVGSVAALASIDGVLGHLTDDLGRPCVLPAAEHARVRDIEFEQHRRYLDGLKVKNHDFKAGDNVRIEDDSAYHGLMAKVERLDGKGRLELMFGMMRHIVPADRVIAA